MAKAEAGQLMTSSAALDAFLTICNDLYETRRMVGGENRRTEEKKKISNLLNKFLFQFCTDAVAQM